MYYLHIFLVLLLGNEWRRAFSDRGNISKWWNMSVDGRKGAKTGKCKRRIVSDAQLRNVRLFRAICI